MVRVHSPAVLQWRKSSRSAASSDCVEVSVAHSATTDIYVLARDSKALSTGAFLSFRASNWSDFLCGVKAGRFDTRPH